jgi:hypothetical protein
VDKMNITNIGNIETAEDEKEDKLIKKKQEE